MDLLEQIYTEATRWYNLPFTIMLGLVLLYWTLSILGSIFGAAFDFDLDVDGEGGVDSDGSGFFARFSRALSDGEAPFTVSLTFFITLMWSAMMLLNYFFNPVSVWGIGIAIMAGSLAIAWYVTRVVMRFFARLIRRIFGITSQKETFIGAVGTVTTGEVTDSFGEIVVSHDGVPCKFSVQLDAGEHLLSKGDHAKIVRKSDDGRRYIVIATEEAPHSAEEGGKT